MYQPHAGLLTGYAKACILRKMDSPMILSPDKIRGMTVFFLLCEEDKKRSQETRAGDIKRKQTRQS